MYIVCVKDFKSKGLQYELTKDKVYESLSKPKWASEDSYFIMCDRDSYFIMCDRGFISAYNKSLFLTLAEYRSNKLQELGI
jgi:hypothetical protein